MFTANFQQLPNLIATFKNHPTAIHNVRHLSDLAGYFYDQQAYMLSLQESNPLVYEYYELRPEGSANLLSPGVTIIQPGQVGREFFMTKGHFHAERDGDEVYLGVSGQGWILLQEEQGIPARLELGAGELAYIPAGWAHRTVNIGSDALVFISLYSVDAGHDYQRIIERGGFPQLAVATPDGAALLDNPAFHITE